MKLRHLLCMAVVGLALSLPAMADESDPFDKFEAAINPETLFRGVIREDDVSLLFKHIRESMAASARGEEARDPEEFNKRAEEISREMAARGGVLLGVLLNAFETTARQVIREEFGGAAPRSIPRPKVPYPDHSNY